MVYFVCWSVMLRMALVHCHFVRNIVDMMWDFMMGVSVKIVIMVYNIMLDLFVTMVMGVLLCSRLLVNLVDGVRKLMIVMMVMIIVVDHFTVNEFTMVVMSIVVFVFDVMVNW